MPEDEKHTLLENIEIEVEEVKRPSMKTEDGWSGVWLHLLKTQGIMWLEKP